MFEKAKALFSLFRAGQAVSNPKAWKMGQVTSGALAAFLGSAVAAAKVFGYEIPISDSDLVHIGAAVLAIYGVFNSSATIISSNKVGLPPVTSSNTKTPPDNDYVGGN